MDKAEWVSTQAFVCMGISIGMILLLPLILMIISWIRKKASVSAALLGVVSFLAGLISYGVIWCLYVVIRTGGFVTTTLPYSYYVVYAVLAGIIAAFWNYIIRKKHYKKHKKPWDSLCFYSGFAFAVSVKTVLPLVENMRVAIKYNQMDVKKLTAQLGNSREGKLALERLYQVSMQDTTKGSAYFLISGLEFLLLLVCFLSMGYLLEQTLKKGNMLCGWFLLLVIFQIGTELPNLLARSNKVTVENREVILAVVAAVAALIVLVSHFKKKQGEGKKIKGKSDLADKTDS